MASKPASKHIVAQNVRLLRGSHGSSQEKLAEMSGLHRTYIGSIERAERNISLENIDRLAAALGVAPVDLLTPSAIDGDMDDRALLDLSLPALRRYQQLATKHGIGDIFQDNGGKLLQMILILGLKALPGREGNDAIDMNGKECELKSVNRSLTSSFSTHHHLNPAILAKYRTVDWYFAVYEGIELMTLYKVSAEKLEPYFTKWETKWYADGNRDINNPKIPLKFIAAVGSELYQSNAIVTVRSTSATLHRQIHNIEKAEG